MKKLAVNILESVGNSLWGFRPLLMKDIVDINGGWKSLTWFVRNMPKYEKILKKWGAERTHLLAVAISGINGCPYCTYGHALSFQLHYFKNKDKLFPIDEEEMMNFNLKDEQQIIESLNDAFDMTNLTQEKKDFQRLLELKSAPELTTNEYDNNINHLVQMFAFLNSCGIKKETKPDFAHDPINKNLALYERYKKARELQKFEPTAASN